MHPARLQRQTQQITTCKPVELLFLFLFLFILRQKVDMPASNHMRQ